MNRCLSCQEDTDSSDRYHLKCLKLIFDKTWLPGIDFTVSDLPEAVSRTIDKMSISGAQMKASVQLNLQTRKLEIVGEGGTHILKPEPAEFPELPQNENLCMNLAEALGMEAAPHGLFSMADKKLCYVVRRFDRLPDGKKVHEEDMAQLLGKGTNEKYTGSLESVGKAILKFTKNKYLELLKFFERVLLCFMIGNGDMHLKNWSLLIPADKNIRLAPCYDLLSSTIYLPHEEESALSVNGKKNGLTKFDFLALADYLNIDQRASREALERLVKAKDKILEMIASSEFSPERKEKVAGIVRSRYARLV